MSTCLNCPKEITQTEGKRSRKFCSDSCRQQYWVKSKKAKPLLEEGKLYSYVGGQLIEFVKPNKDAYDGAIINRFVLEEPIMQSTKVLNVHISHQIAEIRAEKIPAHRNTSIGKKSWEIEQLNRIGELKKQINQPPK